MSGSRRGRRPKSSVASVAAGNFHTNDDVSLQHSLLDSFSQGDSVSKQRQSKDDSKDGDTKKRLIAEVENVMTKVNRSLMAKNVKTAELLKDNEKLMKKVNLLEADNLKLAKIIKTETQSVSEKQQQKEEKNVLLRQLEDRNEALEKCESLLKSLQRQLKEKGEKLEKLVDLIDPLREKVKEQEDLKEQLNQANIENKSLHVANEEFKTALNAKEKQLQNANQLFARSRKSLSEEETKVSDKRIKLDLYQKKLEADEVKLQDQQVKVSHQERLAEERLLQVDAEKKEIAEENSRFQLEKKTIEEEKVMLDTRWEHLNVLKTELSSKKKILDDEQQALEEQKKELEEDKMMIDSEWGDIMARKEELARSPDTDVVEKQEQLAKMEAANKGLQLQLIQIQEELNKARDASNKEVSGLKASREKDELARKVLEEEILLKSGEITELKNKLLLSKIQCEDLVESNLNEKVELEKIIEEKATELVTLKHQISERNFVKRKMRDEEPKDVANKKSKLSDELMMMMNTEDTVDYLPSDIETGIEDADEDSTENSQVNEDDSKNTQDGETMTECVPESSDVRMEDNMTNVKIGESEDAVNDSSKALKQIEEFEYFIKSKRMRDLGRKEKHPDPGLGSSDVYQVSKTSTVKKKVDVINHESSKDVNTKDLKKSIRDVFDDSFESDEGSKSFQPSTSQERCGRYQTEIQDIELNLQCSTLSLPFKSSADIAPIISNSPARTSKQNLERVSSPPKTVLVVKDINTLIMPPCLDKDVIIPSHPSISDPVLDISDTDTQELEVLKKQEEKIERELKFNVADVVKNVLGKFYKTDNGIDSREAFERMASDLTNKFKEDILQNYRLSHDTLHGVSVTKIDKCSIIDQIIFYFEVKGVVSRYLKQYSVVTSSTHPNVSTLTAHFTKEIEESYMTVHNTLAGMKLTEDSKLWIKNKLDVQYSNVRH